MPVNKITKVFTTLLFMLVFAQFMQAQTLGTYPASNISSAGGNTTVTPSAAPTGTTKVTAYTSTNFKGILQVNAITGLVTVTNAHPAGSYTITIKAFGTVPVTTAFTLTVSNTACSQAYFSGTTNVATTAGVAITEVVVGDFNQDGKQDIITVGTSGSTVANVRLGNGDGTFGNILQNISVGSNPRYPVIGDVNGDGRQDVVIANYSSNSVAVRLGNGDGTFSGTTDVSVAGAPRAIVLADFNRDGYLDFAATNDNGGTVSVRLGNGFGGFSGGSEVTVGAAPKLLACGDFNSDGFPDLAIPNQGADNVSIRMGNGDGTFNNSQPDVPTGDGPQQIVIGDFNRDNLQDLAISNGFANTISIRFGNGNGTFSGTSTWASGPGSRAMAAGDFNGDGTQDLAIGCPDTNFVHILLGNPSLVGSFSNSIQNKVIVGTSPTCIAIGDFNGDGMQDLITTNNGIVNASTYSVRLGGRNKIDVTGNGVIIVDDDISPSLADNTYFGPGCLTQNRIRVFKIRNTGNGPLQLNSGALYVTGADASMFTLSGLSLPLSIPANRDTSLTVTFTPASAGVKTATVHIISNNCDVADYNFDVAANNSDATQGSYPNSTVMAGQNTTITPTVAPANATGISVHGNTGFTGIVTINPVTGVVSVTNAGQAGTYQIKVYTCGSVVATFTLTVTNPVSTQGLFAGCNNINIQLPSDNTIPTTLAAGDFNNDGKQDIAVLTIVGGYKIFVRLGNGDGTYGSPVILTPNNNIKQLAVDDFNNDGKQDLVALTYLATAIVFPGDGMGGFGTPVIVDAGVNPYDLSISDFNGDGNRDMAIANQSAPSARISIRLGNGQGAFINGTSVSLSINPIMVKSSDFNLDGNQDLAILADGGGTIFLRLGNGDGSFSNAPSDISTSATVTDFTFGDFNGDGIEDIAYVVFADAVPGRRLIDNGTVEIKLGNGDGTFRNGLSFFSGSSESWLIKSVDFNGDGRQDLALTGFANGNIAIRLGNSTGTFDSAPNVYIGQMGSPPIIGDFNNDGRLDLAVSGTEFNHVAIRLGKSNFSRLDNKLYGHSIPNPQELAVDSVSFLPITEKLTPNGTDPLYKWQRSPDGNTWSDINPAANNQQYYLPPLTATTYYRRIINACIGTFISDTARIKVINPNGVISGRVRSLSGAPVKGIEIAVRKTVSLRGSPQTFTYKDTTDDQGNYSVQRIFYGETDGSAPGSASFTVKPFRLGHKFDYDSIVTTLTNLTPQIAGVDFIDSTVYSISGKTYQECIDCNSLTGQPQVQACPLDSVRVASNVLGVVPVFSGYSPQIDSFGVYGLAIQNPGVNNISASYRNHLFVPPNRSINVTADTGSNNFKDTSTHVISGFLRAGCVDFIGTAVLEFSDILPNDNNGNPRSSCFRKRVTTNSGSGFYSIRLPARKYKVKIVSFSPDNSNSAQVTSPDLIAFFDTYISKDSLTRDITERDTTLNLIYERPPVIVLEGLDNDCSRTPADSAFAIIKQSVTKQFIIKVYQGPAAKGCPVNNDTLIINTNVHQDDVSQTFKRPIQNGRDTIRIKGGIPNIIYPYYKPMNFQFTDIYGRQAAQVNKNIVVTGVKPGTGTFTTTSPQIPLMILHDPPGDNSYSYFQKDSVNETAIRMFTADEISGNFWAQARFGSKVLTGGSAGVIVATENEIWGQINTSLGIGSKTTENNETILTTTATQKYSSSNNPDVIGLGGDVFIGAAINLLYTAADEVTYTPPCRITASKKLMIAQDGFATTYVYSESHIRENVIPDLMMLRDNIGTSASQKDSLNNQISVWQQVLANNEYNIANAAFDRNISFNGAVGPIENTITTSSKKTNTVECSIPIERSVGIELGIMIAGSGAQGGVNATVKFESGKAYDTAATSQTTIGYVLDDDDNGDYYSVDVKKDPVYNTPVFALKAATTSCPFEEGTQPRDEMRFTIPVPIVTGVAADGTAVYTFKLGNTSQSGETRTYRLYFDQGTNPYAAIVTVGGSPAPSGSDYFTYTIPYLAETQVTVTVKKGPQAVFSYEGLSFTLTDNCDGGVSKTASISAYFVSTCSDIQLSSPGNNWVNSSFDNNILPVLFKGYTLANLTSVTLEYSKAGSNFWSDGFTKNAAELNNSANGTLVNWNISGLADGNYNLRMKLNCPAGIVYSERVTGVIDRRAPQLLGIPLPSDDNYVTGDVIAANFNEDLDCTSLTNFNAELTNLSTGQPVNARLGCYQNNIVIVPLTNLAAFNGDSMRVTLRSIADQYGNVKPGTDSWKFIVGNFTPDASNRALKLVNSPASIQENSGDSIIYTFKLPVNAPNDMLVNYTVSGNSIWNTDYTVSYGQGDSLNTNFNGSQGSIVIYKNTRSSILKIKANPDTLYAADKKITLNLLEGGDYLLGDSTSATGTIVNDDTPEAYTFTGNGNFSDPANWRNGLVPPYNSIIYEQIIIDPIVTGECFLDVPLRIRTGGNITLIAGKKFRINGNVRIVNFD